MASETRPGLLALDGRLDLLGYYLCIARISGAGSGVGNEAGAVSFVGRGLLAGAVGESEGGCCR